MREKNKIGRLRKINLDARHNKMKIYRSLSADENNARYFFPQV